MFQRRFRQPDAGVEAGTQGSVSNAVRQAAAHAAGEELS